MTKPKLAAPSIQPVAPPPAPRTFKVLTELPTFSFTDFDGLDRGKAAIRQLETGRFDLATQLVDAMTRDDRLSGALMLRTQGIDVLPMQFKEGKGDGRRGGAIMREAEERWDEFFPKHELQKLRQWATMTGIGVAENRWTYVKETDRLEPRLYTWYPRWVWWNWATRSYWMATMEGQVELAPATGQWLLYAPYGLYRAWTTGLVRSLWVPWMLRQWSLRDSGRYSEAFGSPTKKARFPGSLDDEQRDTFLRAVAESAAETTVALPSSANDTATMQQYDVEFMELVGTGGDLFERMVTLASTNLAVRIIGNNLTTEVKGGSYSAAFVHEHIRQDILRDDCDSLARALKRDTLNFWALYNFGSPELAPHVTWNIEPPEDKAKAAEALKNFADAVKSATLAGIPIDAQQLAERHGVPLREDATDDEKRRPLPLDKDLLRQGLPLLNEARARLGLEDTEGGDALPVVAPPGGAGEDDKKKPGAEK